MIQISADHRAIPSVNICRFGSERFGRLTALLLVDFPALNQLMNEQILARCPTADTVELNFSSNREARSTSSIYQQ